MVLRKDERAAPNSVRVTSWDEHDSGPGWSKTAWHPRSGKWVQFTSNGQLVTSFDTRGREGILRLLNVDIGLQHGGLVPIIASSS